MNVELQFILTSDLDYELKLTLMSFLQKLSKVVFLLVVSYNTAFAQIGLGGFDAVMTVPTAKLLPEGHLAIGFGYIPKPHAIFVGPDHDNLAYFVTFGFLPFMELSLRATKPLNYAGPALIGDRMASLRVRLLSESTVRPALTLGIHDLSAVFREKEWFHSLYAVMTKSIFLSGVAVETTIGYGFDVFEARQNEFNGVFGGISIRLHRLLFLKGEYNDQVNFGIGIELFDFFVGNLVLLDGRDVAFGINLNQRL